MLLAGFLFARNYDSARRGYLSCLKYLAALGASGMYSSFQNRAAIDIIPNNIYN